MKGCQIWWKMRKIKVLLYEKRCAEYMAQYGIYLRRWLHCCVGVVSVVSILAWYIDWQMFHPARLIINWKQSLSIWPLALWPVFLVSVHFLYDFTLVVRADAWIILAGEINLWDLFLLQHMQMQLYSGTHLFPPKSSLIFSYIYTYINISTSTILYRGYHHGIVANVLDCNMVMSSNSSCAITFTFTFK